MPTPALSLVGFLPKESGILHLQNTCIPAPEDASRLEEIWNEARLRLGEAAPNGGIPEVLALGDIAQAHVAEMMSQPWAAQLSAEPMLSAPRFALVEIAPIVAFQTTVDLQRSAHHCGRVANPPSVREMLDICLPLQIASEQFGMQHQPNGILIKARSLNFRILRWGLFGNNELAGVLLGPSLPVVQVVNFNGKSFLWNGYHRAVGLMTAGASHMPCVIRDVVDAAASNTLYRDFGKDVLEGDNIPTLRHFDPAIAHSVNLRRTYKMISVNWTEWAVPEDGSFNG